MAGCIFEKSMVNEASNKQFIDSIRKNGQGYQKSVAQKLWFAHSFTIIWKALFPIPKEL